MRDELTYALIVIFMLGGFLLGYASFLANSHTLRPVLDMVSPTKTVVYLQVSSPIYSAFIFVAGGLFSTGLSLLVSLLNEDKSKP